MFHRTRFVYASKPRAEAHRIRPIGRPVAVFTPFLSDDMPTKKKKTMARSPSRAGRTRRRTPGRRTSIRRKTPDARRLARRLFRAALIYLGFNLLLNLLLALTAPIEISRILELGHLDSRSMAALLLSKHLLWHTSWEAEQSIPARIRWAALDADVDPALFQALVETESGLRPHAISPVGACGLTQLMPSTARMLGLDDPFDPDQNLRGGATYLKKLLSRFDGDFELAVAAYNAGPSRVAKLGMVPRIQETQHYVTKILERFQHLKAEPPPTAPLPREKPTPQSSTSRPDSAPEMLPPRH